MTQHDARFSVFPSEVESPNGSGNTEIRGKRLLLRFDQNRNYFNVILAAALALTLGLKFAVLGNGARPAHQLYAKEVSAVLAAQGYATRIIPRKTGSWITEGTRGQCIVWLRAASGGIGLKHMFEARMGKVGLLRYFANGAELARIPAWSVQLKELAQRSARRLGIDYAVPPVIALAAKPDCTPDMQALSHIPMHYRLGPAIERPERGITGPSTAQAGESRSLGSDPSRP